MCIYVCGCREKYDRNDFVRLGFLDARGLRLCFMRFGESELALTYRNSMLCPVKYVWGVLMPFLDANSAQCMPVCRWFFTGRWTMSSVYPARWDSGVWTVAVIRFQFLFLSLIGNNKPQLIFVASSFFIF